MNKYIGPSYYDEGYYYEACGGALQSDGFTSDRCADDDVYTGPTDNDYVPDKVTKALADAVAKITVAGNHGVPLAQALRAARAFFEVAKATGTDPDAAFEPYRDRR